MADGAVRLVGVQLEVVESWKARAGSDAGGRVWSSVDRRNPFNASLPVVLASPRRSWTEHRCRKSCSYTVPRITLHWMAKFKVEVKVIFFQLLRGYRFYLPNRRGVNKKSQSVLHAIDSRWIAYMANVLYTAARREGAAGACKSLCDGTNL